MKYTDIKYMTSAMIEANLLAHHTGLLRNQILSAIYVCAFSLGVALMLI